METVKIELPQGYSAIVAAYLNFGQKRKLQRLMAQSMKYDAETQTADTSIGGSVLYDAQDLTLEMMLMSLTKPDGSVLEGAAAYKAVQEFNGSVEEVGKALYEKIDELTKSAYSTDEVKKN